MTGSRRLIAAGIVGALAAAVGAFALKGAYSHEPPPQSPNADASPTGDASTANHLIRIHIDAERGATIHPDGSDRAVCTTPCDLMIDPATGDPGFRRFIVRKAGFADHQMLIELDRPPSSIVVQLRAREPGPAEPIPRDDAALR